MILIMLKFLPQKSQFSISVLGIVVGCLYSSSNTNIGFDAVESPSWSCMLSQNEHDQPLDGWPQHGTKILL